MRTWENYITSVNATNRLAQEIYNCTTEIPTYEQ